MKSRRRIAFLKASDHANRISDYSRDLRQAKWDSEPMSALPPKADITAAQTNVRFVPKADICGAQIKVAFRCQ
jgi:hypothetical protein